MAKYLQRSFTGGEISPAMYGRIDDQKYQTGLALCQNLLVLPQGPLQNRSGFEFVRAAKYSDKPCRLIPFVFSSTQTMVLEFGEHYIRFHTKGSTLLDNNDNVYEVETPYAAEDVADIHYAQSADVVTLVHPSYAPRELRRYGALDWRLATIDFGSPLSAPTNLSGDYVCQESTATDAQKTLYTIRYRVTALLDDDSDVKESSASDTVSVTGNLYLNSSKVTLTWSAVTGATRYRVYKTYSGTYGFIGETDGLTFVDTNIAADTSITPPRYDAPFSEGNYPGAVSYFDQRRIFAGTNAKPQFVWMTRSGTESDMSYTLPSQADNRIKFRLAALEASRIEHIMPLQSLVILTNSAEFRVTTANDDVLTPTSIGVKPQSYIGASSVQPVVANSTMLYAAARGGHIRELGYNYQSGGFVTGDLSIRAQHLFENNHIVDMALSKAPISCLWCVTSDGKLLGCTYLPDQGVGGWHRHTTDGTFEAVACVSEGDEDILYAVINRTINGSSVRYIERMHERQITDLEDMFFVDSGLTYEGPTATVFRGLSHLEGKTVSILADGEVRPQQVVENGSVTLDVGASKVHIGLPIDVRAQTLPMYLGTNDGGYGQGRNKDVTRVFVRVYRSSGLSMGYDFDNLRDYPARTNEPYGLPPALRSEELSMLVPPHWADSGQIAISHQNPLPLIICGITADVRL